jgi:hypothetical protein
MKGIEADHGVLRRGPSVGVDVAGVRADQAALPWLAGNWC